MGKVIKITESQLKRVIDRVIKEEEISSQSLNPIDLLKRVYEIINENQREDPVQLPNGKQVNDLTFKEILDVLSEISTQKHFDCGEYEDNEMYWRPSEDRKDCIGDIDELRNQFEELMK